LIKPTKSILIHHHFVPLENNISKPIPNIQGFGHVQIVSIFMN